MSCMPSTIMRAFSRDAPAKLVFLAFGVQMGCGPSACFARADVCYCKFVTRVCSLGLYNIYREFVAAHAVESGASTLEQGTPPYNHASWLLIIFFQFVLECSMLCLCIMLDKKQHGVQIGRKFFTAEAAAARKNA